MADLNAVPQPVVLINPNTTLATTQKMVEIARDFAALQGAQISLSGLTAKWGAPLITTDVALAEAGDAVIGLLPEIPAGTAAVIVSAFGDPGLEGLRGLLSIPVVGIAEAAFLVAGINGRRFSVATTTSELVGAITHRAGTYGFGDQLASVRLTEGEAVQLMADEGHLTEALGRAVELAVREDGAEAVIIGGGPLAVAARHLANTSPVPLIEPIPAAVRLVTERIAATVG
ncbi:aspartate/glutamate racemase family protein [Roseibium algae]|uniref:Aspartate/glutamate racemase family protein n=1 Tax=Roseibium algae TaxID=3123038 RepID=A0ABU8TI41_9HYPH